MTNAIISVKVKDDVYACIKIKGNVTPSKLGILLLKQYSKDNGNTFRQLLDKREIKLEEYDIEYLGDIYSKEEISKLTYETEDDISYVYTLNDVNKWICKYNNCNVPLSLVAKYVNEKGTHNAPLKSVTINVSNIDYDLEYYHEASLDITYAFEIIHKSGSNGYFLFVSSVGEFETDDGIFLKFINPQLDKELNDLFTDSEIEVNDMLSKVLDRTFKHMDLSDNIEIELD